MNVSRSTRRLLLLLLCLPVSLLVLGGLYSAGMQALEGKSYGLWEGLEWAAETLTTTGYGADTHWRSPLMVIFVIAVQFLGLFLVFLIFPVYVIPFFEERFEARIPRSLPELDGQVLIYRYTPAIAALLSELARFGRRVLVVEPDEGVARRLQERGQRVVLLDLDNDPPERLALDGAAALVGNGSDHENASVAITARESGYAGHVYALAEDPLHRLALTAAGADHVFTPRHALAAAIAARVSERISPNVLGLGEMGTEVGVSQVRVSARSALAGQTLEQATLRERMGIIVLALWQGQAFIDRPRADTRLGRGAILLVFGTQDALERLAELATPIPRTGNIVIIGYGEVGSKVAELLGDAGEPVTVVNDRPGEGVDVVGNALHAPTLQAAKIRSARTVVLSIGNDSESLFVAAMVREAAPDVPLVARVNQDQSVGRMHRLGVDYALSVGQVVGQLLAHHLLGEDYVTVEHGLRVVKASPLPHVGSHPWRIGLREETGCQVVAVARGGNILVELGREFVIEPADTLYLCGTGDALETYFRRYPETREAPSETRGVKPAA